ncbi:ABC transporter permease [Paenibacillus cymbidii]|uniref:ABC transporter permease n=1 Tax=Paenibacillus cymbidii TaxID=1639034 RepID=UPI001081C446|nr:ABC transporter permease subunit [Paenibacillus cymbidii]
MENSIISSAGSKHSRGEAFKRHLLKYKYAYLLLLPGLVHLILFRYVPMFGIMIAFQKYSPFLGFWKSPWIGLEHFQNMFSYKETWIILRNTIILSALQIAFAFPAPIILSLILNELKDGLFKRLSQSILYLPHFLSWVIVVGIVLILLRSDGFLNLLLQQLFHTEAIPILTSEGWFRPLIVAEVIWKEVGWGTIIFLAALSAVSPELYEASTIDGAGRFRKMWHVTLPGIRGVIVILLILKLGDVLDTGFEQSFLQMNSSNASVARTIDIYVFEQSIGGGGQYSFTTAVNLLKNIAGLILIWSSNRIAKKLGHNGIF